MKRRIVFILMLIFSLAINLVSMHYGIFNIAQHLFYIPIILGVFFFEKKGVFLSLFVSALYVGTVLIYDSDYSDLPQTVVRAFILIFIAVLIDWMIARYKNKESEIEAFFNINAEMMCVSGHDGNFLRVNRAFEDVLGYGKEEFEHYSFTELIHPDDLVTTSKAMARLKDSGQVTEYVNRCRCRDGSYKYIEWRSFPFRDVVYSTARDITERTRLIHQLKSNENRMKFAEDLANLGSWEMNPETEEFRWSQGMYRILGLDPGLSMPGIGLMKKLIYPDDWENVEKVFKRNSGNPNDFDFEARFRRPDGNLRWIHSKGMLFLDGAGEKQKYFGFFMDITDRKAAEKIQKQNLAGYKSLMEIYQHKADSEKDLLTYIVSQAVGLTGSRGGAIYFCDEKAGRMFMAAGAGEDQIRFGKSVAFDASCAAARAYRERRRIMLNRASGDVGGADKSLPMLAVPVFDGESVVAVAAVADKTLAYDESDGWLLLMMMRNVWELVLRRRTELRFFRERQWFETTLLSIGDGVIATDADGIIRLVNKKAETLTGFSKEEKIGRDIREAYKIYRRPDGKEVSVTPEDFQRRDGMVDFGDELYFVTAGGESIDVEVRAAEMRSSDRETAGYVIIFRDVTQKKKIEREIIYLTYHDKLTGLYNRRFFEQELIQMDMEKNLPLSVIMGDVNGLKLTNDAFGHLAGDSLLKAAASVMRKSCGKDDIVARWGGDEYIILLPNTDNREAGKIAEHIRATCAETMVGNISLSISLGYSTKARAKDDLMEALKRADDSMYKSKLIEGRSMKSGAVNTIINTLHEKNPREKNHSLRVGAICRQIGLAMGFLQTQITDMELLARIHDIGKISIDEQVLEKTGKLTREELEEIHRHPETGYYIIGASPELSYLANDVLSHHERWDGGGYPNHLAGNNIPLLARILSIADAYEAMTGERQYKKAMTKVEAMEELKRCSGSQFDPVITEKLLTVLKDDNCLI